MTSEYLTVEQAASELGIAVTTMRQHCQSGQIGRRVGRDWVITRPELEQFKKTRRSPGRPPKR